MVAGFNNPERAMHMIIKSAAGLLLLLATANPAASGEIRDDLRSCAAIAYAPARLICYDELVLGIGVAGPVSAADTRRALEMMLREVEARERCEAAGRDDCGPLYTALTMNAEAAEEAMRGILEAIEAINAEEALQKAIDAEKARQDESEGAFDEEERHEMQRLIENNQ
jgi:hypothetical protein